MGVCEYCSRMQAKDRQDADCVEESVGYFHDDAPGCVDWLIPPGGAASHADRLCDYQTIQARSTQLILMKG